MLTLTKNGRKLRDVEAVGLDRLPASREDFEMLGREGLKAGREGLKAGREKLHVGREGLQTIGTSVVDLADNLPLRKKRRRSFPLIGAIVVAIAGTALIALIASLQMRRNGGHAATTRSKPERGYDDDAARRAADAGGTAVGASAADDLIGADVQSSVANEAGRGPASGT
jgi:hypothetical protein